MTGNLRKRKGFTLVELSIVLVIIGLLIGGVLVAQSMIESARINKIVQGVSQYQIAIKNFNLNYNQMPGDSDLFGGTGDKDNQIEWAWEVVGFWRDLSVSRMLKETYTSGTNLGTNQARSAWSSTAGYVAQYQAAPYNIEPTQNILRLMNFPNGAMGSPTDVVSPVIGQAIDSKMDNGIGSTGRVTGYTGNAAGGTCVGSGGAVTWVTTYTDNRCIIYFSIDRWD